MSTAASVLRALPHDRQTGHDRAVEHGLAEASNDVETIMETISGFDQHFAIVTQTGAGELTLTTAFDLTEVRSFYVDRVREWALEGVYRLKRVSTPWYSFVETFGELYMNESDTHVKSHVAVIFPTWTDGIIGEITWEPVFADPVADWRTEGDVSRRFDDLEDAWRSGDIERMLEHVADDTCSVIGIAEVTGSRHERVVARSKSDLSDAWAASGRIVDVAPTNRVVTQHYAFASHRVIVETAGRHVERELARLFPVGTDGRFIGELSYAFELDVTS